MFHGDFIPFVIIPANLDRAGIGRTHAEDEVDERGFSRTIRTNQSIDRTGRHREVERAQAEAAEIAARAAADVEASRSQALADLSAEVSTLAVGAAERVVTSSLDEDTKRKLVEDYITKVGASS